MSSKAIRVEIDLIPELIKLRSSQTTYNKNNRPSFSAVIRKLIHDSQELCKIEQFAMSGNDSTSSLIKFNHEAIRNSQKASKKSYKKSSNSIHLFCSDCQTQTPQRKLETGEWKCSLCGTKRNI